MGLLKKMIAYNFVKLEPLKLQKCNRLRLSVKYRFNLAGKRDGI
jgi:hypothetical protein